MMWGYGYDTGMGGWLMMAFGNILWIVLLGLLVWVVIRWIEQRPGILGPRNAGTSANGPSALETLSRRYAQGEIDTATFEQMRERLQASDSSYRSGYEKQQPTPGAR